MNVQKYNLDNITICLPAVELRHFQDLSIAVFQEKT